MDDHHDALDDPDGPWVRDQPQQRIRDLDQDEWERDPDYPHRAVRSRPSLDDVEPDEPDEIAGAVDEASGLVYSDADPGL